MTATTIEAPVDPVAAAEAALDEVHARIERGEQATAFDLAQAEMDVRLATKRRDLATKVAAEEAERERLARIEVVKARVAKRLDPATLEPARAKLAAALDAWVDACLEYEDVRSEAWGELTGLATSHDDQGRPRLPGVSLGSSYGGIAIGGTTYRPARVQATIAAEAERAIRARFPRTEINLGKPQD